VEFLTRAAILSKSHRGDKKVKFPLLDLLFYGCILALVYESNLTVMNPSGLIEELIDQLLEAFLVANLIRCISPY